MTMTHRKRPVEVEAKRLETVDDLARISTWLDAFGQPHAILLDEGALLIQTLEGAMRAVPGDWVIQGTRGEFYPCKPDAFDDTFEPIIPGA